MRFIKAIQGFLADYQNEIKSAISVLSMAVSIATFVMTRWVQRRMRREAQERHEDASRLGDVNVESSTVDGKGLLKNEVYSTLPLDTVIRDRILFKKIMDTPNRDVVANEGSKIGSIPIGLLQLLRPKDTKALLLACATEFGRPFIVERFRGQLSKSKVEIQMLVSFRHDTYVPSGPEDGFKLSRAIVAPLKLVERIGTDAEFRESVKTVEGKEHQLDRLYHMWEMWKAYTSTDLDTKATVWQFTLTFPADAFPEGFIEWMD